MKLENLLNEYKKEKVSTLIAKMLNTVKVLKKEALKLKASKEEPATKSEGELDQTDEQKLLLLTDLTQDMKSFKRNFEDMLKISRAELSASTSASIHRAIQNIDDVLKCLSDVLYLVSVGRRISRSKGEDMLKKTEAFYIELNNNLVPGLRSDGLLNVSVSPETFRRHGYTV